MKWGEDVYDTECPCGALGDETHALDCRFDSPDTVVSEPAEMSGEKESRMAATTNCPEPVEGKPGTTCGRLPGHHGTHREFLTRKQERESKGAAKAGPAPLQKQVSPLKNGLRPPKAKPTTKAKTPTKQEAAAA